jgi:hypothetical protein
LSFEVLGFEVHIKSNNLSKIGRSIGGSLL